MCAITIASTAKHPPNSLISLFYCTCANQPARLPNAAIEQSLNLFHTFRTCTTFVFSLFIIVSKKQGGTFMIAIG